MSIIKKNFLYNILYQFLVLIIPLITAPYLSRTVGASGVGIYSYTYSIVYYFMLLCLLGVNNYGNRTIAKVRDDKEKMSKTFFEIYIFQLIMGFIMIILYIIYIYAFNIKYQSIAFLQIMFLLSSIFDINWFFFGLEEFKVTIIRNSIVKILSLVLIFLLVKTNDDLWKYVFIMSGTTLISQLAIWPFLKGKIKITNISIDGIINHIKPNIILFIPVVAVSIYKIMDKIMLGMMSTIEEVGFYENAEKIVHIPVVIIAALGTVMLPRITNMLSNGKIKEAKSYIYKSLCFVMFLSFAMMFGLIAISEDFAPFYFGIEFKKSGILIMLLSITLPFLAFANVIRTQYLIPKEKDRIYLISVILGAVVNLIMNLIFIPKYSSIGACIGTISAEIVVMIYQSISVKNDLNFVKYFNRIIEFFVKSCIMFLVVYSIKYLNISVIIKLSLQIIVGSLSYLLLNFKYVKDNLNISKLLNRKKNS